MCWGFSGTDLDSDIPTAADSGPAFPWSQEEPEDDYEPEEEQK